ncbi:transferase family-domain-containing protein [Usnea florida]
MAVVADEPFVLTPIDNILPRYQVSKLLFFPSSTSVTTTETIGTLRRGLEKTIQAFPLLAGTVQEIQPASDHEQKGRLCVSAPWHTIGDIFSVQDLTNDGTLEYSSLREDRFPGHKLDAKTILPQDKASKPNTKSVMLAKVNKIRGGLIVVHSLSHGFMDGGGMAVIAKLWAAFCRGEDGSKYLTPSMLDRSRLMRGISGSQVTDFPELSHTSSPAPMPAIGVQPQDVQYEMFFFSRQKLDELKKMASNPENLTEKTDWISTSDALCALLAHSIKIAQDEQTPLTLGLAMDFRASLNPPLAPDYVGNAVHMLNVSLPEPGPEDKENAIAITAHRIRRTIQSINDDYIHRMIGALNADTVPDISKIVHSRTSPRGGQFLTITSWAKQPLYELDWGGQVGTRIERVRVPKFQYPNLVLIAPMFKGEGFGVEEGGVEVIFGLEGEGMTRVKRDALFGRFARWGG